MKRSIVYVALGMLLAGLLSAGSAAGAAVDGLVYVGIVNPDGAQLHVQIDPRIPANAVMIYHGANVVIYNATGATITPVPGVTLTPTRSATPPAMTPTPTRTLTPTPGAVVWRATVRRSPRLLVMSRAGGGAQVGAVGYGAVLEIVEEQNWWGRIESPVTGWIDLTYCEVSR